MNFHSYDVSTNFYFQQNLFEKEKEYRFNVQQQMISTLKRQIDEQKQLEEFHKEMAMEERKRSEKLLAEIKAEDDRLAEQKRMARTKISQDLKTQLQLQETYKQNKAQKDADFMDMFHKSILDEIKKEKEKSSEASLELKKQVEHFLQYKQELKNQMEQEEREREKLIRENYLKSECKAYKEREEMKNKKKHITKSTYEEVRNQILHRSNQKHVDDQIEFAAAVADHKKIQSLLDEDKRREHEKKMAALEYGKELLMQDEQFKMRQRYERQHEKELIGNFEKEQEECDEFIKSYILKGKDILPPHPNYRLMKSQ